MFPSNCQKPKKRKFVLHEISSASPEAFRRRQRRNSLCTQSQFLVKFMSLSKGVKLKFHALLAKTIKNHKFAKKCLLYPLILVRGHLKIIPSYSAFQIRKSQEIPEFYQQR